MKIVDAFWEKRNLDRKVLEVTLDKRDLRNPDGVMAALADDGRFSGAYVVVKLPTGNLSLLHRLEDAGFRFLETQFSVSRSIENYELPSGLKGMVEPCELREVPKTVEAWRKASDLITPEMFHTDRVALDPLFSLEDSCRRYRNWIMDLVDKPDSHLLLAHYPGLEDPVGISLDRYSEGDRVFHALLGGAFPGTGVKGAGISMQHSGFLFARQLGCTWWETVVCSNNAPIVRVDSEFGYVVDKMAYVLRKEYAS